jgi:hypothetical protein
MPDWLLALTCKRVPASVRGRAALASVQVSVLQDEVSRQDAMRRTLAAQLRELEDSGITLPAMSRRSRSGGSPAGAPHVLLRVTQQLLWHGCVLLGLC